jgi:Sec7 domain
VFRVPDAQGRFPIQYATKNGREDNLKLLLLAGHFVPPFLLESDEVPPAWKDIIKQMVPKRDDANTYSPEKRYPFISSIFPHLFLLSFPLFSFSLIPHSHAIAVQEFNKKPKKGIDYLVGKGLILDSPQEIGHFLYTTVGLSKRKLGDFLGEGYVNLGKLYLVQLKGEGKTKKLVLLSLFFQHNCTGFS